MFTKFGTLRDPDLLRTCALPNWNRKLTRDVNGHHRENYSDVIKLITTSPMVRSDSYDILSSDAK